MFTIQLFLWVARKVIFDLIELEVERNEVLSPIISYGGEKQ